MRIAIIGAGAAGLSAARFLAQAGEEVVVLEAKDRAGGRIHSVKHPGTSIPTELGAEFMHGSPRETMELINAGRLRTEEIDAPRLVSVGGHVTLANDFEAPIDGVLRSVSLDAADESVTDLLARVGTRGEAARRTLSYVSSFHAADPSLVSTHSLLRSQIADATIDVEHQRFFPNGYSQLVDLLTRDLLEHDVSLRFEFAVEQVRWRRGAVELRGPAGAISAEAAIVTLPIGVLRSGDVRFTPALDAKVEALDALEPGHALRYTLRLRRPTWKDSSDPTLRRAWSFLLTDDERIPTIWRRGAHDDVLVAWSAGPYADRMPSTEVARREELVRSVARQLKLTATQLDDAIEGIDLHDWNNDPFARGAYSWYRRGGEWAAELLAAPLDETLYFAGEATDVCFHNGTVHGALASGLRAAKQILRRDAMFRPAIAVNGRS